MANDAAAFFERWETDQQRIQEEAPTIMRGFGGMKQALMKKGALSAKEKALIALGVGLSERCVPCMNLHIKACLEAGATREQVLEAAGAVVMMRGGPAFVHLPQVIQALDYLENTDEGC